MTAGVIADVVAPLFARGIILRRPRMTELQDRLDADRRAVKRLQRLRDRYGPGPVMLAVPGRNVAVILAPNHVRRALAGTPEPFATATQEKRAALRHFQPHGVLISHGAERAERRRFNEAVLDTDNPVHTLHETFALKVEEEAAAMLARPVLGWDAFARIWWRLVRRVVLGEGARHDEPLTDLLARLRADANWAFLKPRRHHLREQFLERLAAHLARAEAGSLAACVASTPAGPEADPLLQVPQWLFAFDAAGMAAFRALALIDAHDPRRTDDAFLRACVLESVRLWPTTPAILRETTDQTTWETGTLPPQTTLLMHAPFFHRDDTRLEFADRFAPHLWLSEAPEEDWPLVPFSAGPARCAGRDLVLLLTSSLIANLSAAHELRQERLSETGKLPATFSPFSLRYSVVPR
jgi:cytochrome P450